MSEPMRPEDTTGVPSGHQRITGPASIRSRAAFFDARADADEHAVVAARLHHEGLSARVVESGEHVRTTLERLRHRGTPSRAELRPLSDALSKHLQGTEATARRVLEHRAAARAAVQEDRDEGERLRRFLDQVIAGDFPTADYPMTVGAVLAGIDQFVGHERRDLVPVIDRELSPLESARLARTFSG